MTISWLPELPADETVGYDSIAGALARDVERGALSPGTRLPTHRELAAALGVSVGTVSRAYSEAARRGLTVGEVGRGTFVREREAGAGWGAPHPQDGPPVVDLSLCVPPLLPEDGESLADTVRGIDSRVAGELLRYQPESGTARQRAAFASWIARTGFEPSPDDVLLTVGTQHALTVALGTLLRPGDVLLTGELTYPGIKSLAAMLGIRLVGVALDDEGVIPDAVREAGASSPAPTALYLVPTIQNPTGALASAERREELAAVVRELDLILVEDDVHAALPKEPSLPVAALVPDRTLYASSLSKALSIGLRVGYMVAPRPWRERLLAGIRSTSWMAPALAVEVATRLLESGAARRLLESKRKVTGKRQEVARRALAPLEPRGHPAALHLWLPLPEPWRSDEIVARARQRGVLLAGVEAFVVGRREAPHAVRLALGPPRNTDELRRAVEVVGEVVTSPADPCVDVL